MASQTHKSRIPRWVTYTLGAIILWGLWGIVSKLAADDLSSWTTHLLFTAGLIPPALWCSRRQKLEWKTASPKGLLLAFLAGLSGALGNIAFFAALEKGNASLATTMSALYPLITVLLGTIFLKERLQFGQLIGLALAMGAILLFAYDEKILSTRAQLWANWFWLALTAVALWGVTGALQKKATETVSPELAFCSFTAAFLPLGLLVLAMAPLRIPQNDLSWLWGIAGGILNGVGSIFSFAAYASGGAASIVTPLGALYPGITVLLAVFLLGESIGQWQSVAILLSILGGLALSLAPSTNDQRGAETKLK